jgi:transposase
MVPKEIRRMSHSKVEASRKRRVFSEEFKQDAVRLVVIEKYSFAAAAKAVGIGEQSLRRWHTRLAPQPVPCGENASLDELRAENQRLRRELRRAELEREILKKLRQAKLGEGGWLMAS